MSRALIAGLMTTLLFVPAGVRAEYLAYPASLGPGEPLPEDLSGVHTLHLVDLEWSEYHGRKARVGVQEVENKSRMASYQADSPYGAAINIQFAFQNVPVQGIEAMVTNALFESGRFQVLERSELDSVLAEQNLGASGRVHAGSAATIGKIVGAEYLVKVEITSYDPNAESSNVGLGGLASALGKNAGLLGAVGISSKAGFVGMNFRLIDAQTSEVIFTKQVERKVSETGLSFGGAGVSGGGAFGGFISQYRKTPIGQAVMAAINEGVYELVKQVGAQPVRGSVAKVAEDQVYLTLGRDAVEPGQRFRILRRGESIIDPDTGIELGSEDTEIGMLEIARTEARYSIGRMVSGSVPQVGDRVLALEPPQPIEFGSLTKALQEKPSRKRNRRTG